MKDIVINLAFMIRARIMRSIRPMDSYWIASKNTQPLSRKFGIDRGTPIDRYYIEEFIGENSKHIKGVCLEVGDDRYITQFGKNVTKADILDVVSRKKVSIIGDLRNVPQIKDGTYDCIILTQVLGMIDDLDSVVSEIHRILKKGGVVLITTSALSPCIDYDLSFWRFTTKSIEYLLLKKFNGKNVSVKSFGNALTSQVSYVGGVQEDLKKAELDINDKKFPTIVVAKGFK